ncbi:MAG: hypothetical protein ACO276_07375 [Ilumatobacteraceae bacterium]
MTTITWKRVRPTPAVDWPREIFFFAPRRVESRPRPSSPRASELVPNNNASDCFGRFFEAAPVDEDIFEAVLFDVDVSVADFFVVDVSVADFFVVRFASLTLRRAFVSLAAADVLDRRVVDETFGRLVPRDVPTRVDD